ncbi:MAG: chaperonin Cpn10 [Bryobacterales bacterium]|nr:chaperonin Cpn10 [Bryobacterales bacterium]
MVKPLHDRLLAKRVEEQNIVVGGIVIPDTAKDKPTRASVFAVGTGHRLKDGGIAPLVIKVGDQILLGKFSGTEVVVDGEEYLILREDEVLAVLDGESEDRTASERRVA